jgi:hypothetical protein
VLILFGELPFCIQNISKVDQPPLDAADELLETGQVDSLARRKRFDLPTPCDLVARRTTSSRGNALGRCP